MPAALFRDPSHTLNPRARNARAVASPMPLFAPVISATFGTSTLVDLFFVYLALMQCVFQHWRQRAVTTIWRCQHARENGKGNPMAPTLRAATFFFIDPIRQLEAREAREQTHSHRAGAWGVTENTKIRTCFPSNKRSKTFPRKSSAPLSAEIINTHTDTKHGAGVVFCFLVKFNHQGAFITVCRPRPRMIKIEETFIL